jgi:hypothetical protein
VVLGCTPVVSLKPSTRVISNTQSPPFHALALIITLTLTLTLTLTWKAMDVATAIAYTIGSVYNAVSPYMGGGSEHIVHGPGLAVYGGPGTAHERLQFAGFLGDLAQMNQLFSRVGYAADGRVRCSFFILSFFSLSLSLSLSHTHTHLPPTLSLSLSLSLARDQPNTIATCMASQRCRHGMRALTLTLTLTLTLQAWYEGPNNVVQVNGKLHLKTYLFYEPNCGGTVRGFRQKFTLEDAIGSHACSLEANTRVTKGSPLESSLLLPVDTVNCVQTLKVQGTFRLGGCYRTSNQTRQGRMIWLQQTETIHSTRKIIINARVYGDRF